MSINLAVEEYRSNLGKKLKKNPQDAGLLIQLAVIEFEYFHESEKALSLLEKATEIDPLNTNAKFWLAMCLYYEFFEYAKAEEILKNALRQNPNSPECLSLLAWIIRETDGPLNEAIEYVQKALKSAPEWPMLRWQLARLFLLTGNIEAAESEVQKAFSLHEFDQSKITNEVERYYESVVTGRGWANIKEEFRDILKQIQETKFNT